MGAGAFIATVDKTEDGQHFRAIRCHSDPSPHFVGRTLLEHYSDPAKVDALLDLGFISILGEEIGEAHSSNWRQEYDHLWDVYPAYRVAVDTDPRSNWCVAYRRDWGRDDTPAVECDSTEELVKLAAHWEACWLYVYDRFERQWWVQPIIWRGRDVSTDTPAPLDSFLITNSEGEFYNG